MGSSSPAAWLGQCHQSMITRSQTSAPRAQRPGQYSLLSGLVTEVVLTMTLLFIIMGSTHGKAPAGFAPIAIGLCLTLIHLISIPAGPFCRRLGYWTTLAVLGCSDPRRCCRGPIAHWISEEPSGQVTGTTTTGKAT